MLENAREAELAAENSLNNPPPDEDQVGDGAGVGVIPPLLPGEIRILPDFLSHSAP